MLAPLLAAAVLLPAVPGATNPAVTQKTISATICMPGWTRTKRPSTSYTGQIKADLMQKAGSTDGKAWELDHLISLELGGSPRSKRNLWLQPIRPAKRDDNIEDELRAAVCDGDIPLRVAQRLEVSFKKVYG